MEYVYMIFVCLYCLSYVSGTDSYHGNVNTHVTRVKSQKNSSSANVEFNSARRNVKTKLKSESEDGLYTNNIDVECENSFICMQLDLLKNVGDIMRTDVYNLTNYLVLEKYPDIVAKNDIVEKDLRRLKDPAKRDFGYLSALLMKRTLDIFKTHSMKWNALPGFDLRVFQDVNNGGKMDVALEMPSRDSRTFIGPRRKLMFLLMPLMYKMGVMTTMLTGLIVLTLKLLTIGVILLILAVGNSFGKYKHYGGSYHHGPSDIHVHVHSDPHVQAYSGWQHEDHHPGHYSYHRRKWPVQPAPLTYYTPEPVY
ncbi:hypothetical protein C0J52_11180 [Blattella germanica]|nr:hypothetical protein C0J52_11180 [Blattella germanica]